QAAPEGRAVDGALETPLGIVGCVLALLPAPVGHVLPAGILQGDSRISDASLAHAEPLQRGLLRVVEVEGIGDIAQAAVLLRASVITPPGDPRAFLGVDLAEADELAASQGRGPVGLAARRQLRPD